MSLKLDVPWLTAPGPRAVMTALTGAGHQAWFVGGCVRNALLRRPDSDIDIATTARPHETEAAGAAAGLKTVPTGADHGTITVVVNGEGFEVTTLRRDVETDGRHAVVRFADRIADDAARRDFTMNALYALSDGTVVDPLGGIDDLRAGRVRFIGDAEIRIREDYLRILRFFRFTAWYGDPAAGLDAQGLSACAAMAEGIDRLASERIGTEMRKLLSAPDPAPVMAAMAQTGILARVLPGAQVQALAPLVHLEGTTPPEPMRRLAALGGEDLRQRLRLSRAESRRLKHLRQSLSGPSLSAIANADGLSFAWDVALVQAAVLEQPVAAGLRAELEAASRARFPITAQDLMPGLQGKALGDRLADLRAAWVASGFTLDKAALLSRLCDRPPET